jgi:hypothetical protein
MKRIACMSLFCCFLAIAGVAQSFEILDLQDSYKGLIGEVIKAPVHFKNTSDKSVTLILRKVNAVIGGTQRNFFCYDNHCFDHRLDEYAVRIEPGQTSSLLQIALEAGLVPGSSSIKYVAVNKSNAAEAVEFDLHFTVAEETAEKEHIYSSRYIVVYNAYPNPVVDHAYLEYKMFSDQMEAKIVLHNILGNSIESYILSPLETKTKIKAETLSAGIYFYTLYLDNEAVATRKLVVKK